MSLPSKPYATSSQVAMIIPILLGPGQLDFTEETVPRKSAVDQYLIWISNNIDLQFQQAGYVLPFAELSGETWPIHQSHYLEMLAALGSAALAGGHVLKPAPAVSPGRGVSTGNIYQDLYNFELKKIWDQVNKSSWIRFRCQTYMGTPAEYSITEPIGPALDYMFGKMNPEDFISFQAYTQLKYNIQTYMEYSFDGISPLDWNDFFGLVSTKLGGYSYAATNP